MTTSFTYVRQRWLWPLILLALFTPWSAQLDIAVEQLFYTPAAFPDDGFIKHSFFLFWYRWGPLPAQVIGCGTLCLLIISYTCRLWRWLRKPCWLILLTLLLGAVLITHVLLKDHWGRPRPKQIELFGGQQPFRPYYQPNFWHQPEPSKSFACGHCTAGFFFFAVALLGEELKKPWMHYGGYGLAIFIGGMLGWTRMAQGGHFLSDILATAVIMWETALLVHWWLYAMPYRKEIC